MRFQPDTSLCRLSGSPRASAVALVFLLAINGSGCSSVMNAELTWESDGSLTGLGASSLGSSPEGGSAELAVPSLSYAGATGASVGVGAAMSVLPTTLSSNGSAIIACVATPSLPSGLTLHPSTCEISGALNSALGPTVYAISAVNAIGASSAASVTLSVIAAAATQLVFTAQPSVTGVAGVDLSAQPVVEARDAGGNAVAAFGGAILLSAFSDAACSTAGVGTLSGGSAVAVSGVAVFAGVDYTRAGALYLKATSGALASACSAAVSISAGAASLAQSIATLGATTIVRASTTTALFSARDAFGNALGSGGLVVDFVLAGSGTASVSFGATVDNGDGTYSSLLTGAAAGTSNSVVARIGGSPVSSALPAIAVTPIAPSGLLYPRDAVVYVQGQAISVMMPGLAGDPLSGCVSSPALPAGLSLNALDCSISGVPSSASALSAYSITATNGGGSANAIISVGVKPVEVIGLGSISAGGMHSCAIVSGGVQCWGDNSRGQLGTGDFVSSSVPRSVTGLGMGAQAISVGGSTSCAIVNGAAYCWGYGGYQQLGQGADTSDYPIPLPVAGMSSGVLAISVGSQHVCAIRAGKIHCWGDGASGRLGNGLAISSGVPVEVSGFSGGAQAISAGYDHSCAIVSGVAYCWGARGLGQLGDNVAGGYSAIAVAAWGLTEGVQSIAVGESHSCAVVNAAAYCWGSNAGDRLGIVGPASSAVPLAVTGQVGGFRSVSIGAQGDFTCGLVDHQTRCWGNNSFGQFGIGNTSPQTGVVNVGMGGFQAISLGTSHACAIIYGALKCWGDNEDGKVGDGTITDRPSPVSVVGLGRSTLAVSAGYSHTCAVVDGGARCWGDNVNGAVGDGTIGVNRLLPVVPVGLSSGVTLAAAGVTHSCAVLDGALKCWGDNAYGQLGNGTLASSAAPVGVVGAASDTQAIAIGLHHTCSLASGNVYCWGDNTYGQLGTVFSTTRSSTPVSAGTFANARALVAGRDHTCVIADDAGLVTSTVRCWGRNDMGQLGDGTTTNRDIDVFTGLTGGLTSLAAGAFHTCAVQDGAIKCWGRGTDGQLGLGNTSNYFVPQAVAGAASGAQALSAGEAHTCAVIDGSVKCWGDNAYGQLGDGTGVDRLTPTTVLGMGGAGAQSVSAGGQHACALAKGRIFCWGRGDSGQLGTGSSSTYLSPIDAAL